MKTKQSTINSQLINSNRGSALVLTVIVMINALLIVATIASISIVERKASNKTKNSTPAFQAADSAVEWTLKKLKDSATVSKVGDLCQGGVVHATSGKCVPDFALPNADMELYFIDGGGSVIKDANDSIYDIVLLRAIGRFGVGEDRVSRALEVSVSQISPIAWWPFADGKNIDGESAQGDTVLDISGNANDATANDGTWQTASNPSECFAVDEDICMEFDGQGAPFTSPFTGNNFADVPHLAPIYEIDQGAVSLWFKVDDLSSDGLGLFSKEAELIGQAHLTMLVLNQAEASSMGYAGPFPGGDHYLGVRLQENTGGTGGNSYWLFSDKIDADVWYFAVFTFGVEGMKLYIAEETDLVTNMVDSDPHDEGIGDNTEPIQFAVTSVSRASGSDDPLKLPLDGFLDDIRIYNKQLKQGQIDKLYSNGPY